MQRQCEIVYPHQMATAHVIIKCRSGSEDVSKYLNSIPGVKVHRTLGAYDILAKVEAEDLQSLKKTIRWKISNNDQISSIVTLICMARSLCACSDINEERIQ